jgi:hypothetical protein
LTERGSGGREAALFPVKYNLHRNVFYAGMLFYRRSAIHGVLQHGIQIDHNECFKIVQKIPGEMIVSWTASDIIQIMKAK